MAPAAQITNQLKKHLICNYIADVTISIKAIVLSTVATNAIVKILKMQEHYYQ